MEPVFVDCHSHVCPSGDDGAPTVAEGLYLCDSAGAHGTRILFATPHVWPHLPLSAERERRVREDFALLRSRARTELRLGFELTPDRPLLGEDPHRYELEGTGCVLMEVPFAGDTNVLHLLAAHVESHGLTPVIAHPERTDVVLEDYEEAVELARRGWPLQVNATSVTGRHGPTVERIAWRLIEEGHASLVASDGHRQARPPHLDEAWERVCERVGEEAARPLFDGTALGLATRPLRPASRAGSPDA